MKKLINFQNFRGDLLGGITAGIVALPLALAFGVSSGLGPVAGLYGAIFLSFFAALFGGTNTQISGPTAPMTAISMVVIATITASFEGESSKAIPIILTIFLAAGLIQIILGTVGVGKYVRYIPYPVLSGFMNAIGIIIIITQLVPSTGYDAKKDIEFVEKFMQKAEQLTLMNMVNKELQNNQLNVAKLKDISDKSDEITPEQVYAEAQRLAKTEASGVLGTLKVLPRAIQQVNKIELMLVLATLIIIFGFKFITRKIPSSLIAVLLVSGVAIFFDLNYKTIQEIPSGIPVVNLEIFTEFELSSISPYLFSAFMLAALGCIDSLLTSVVADNLTKTRHAPNSELIGQGIGNSIGALFGGIPGAGTTATTVINIKSGGKTKLSGMLTGLFLLMVVFFLSPLASKIPVAVLSGILISVGIGIIDYKGIKTIPYIPKGEALMLLIVFMLSALWNLVYAVGIGLVLACILFAKRIGDLSEKKSELSQLRDEPKEHHFVEIPDDLRKNIYVVELEGALFFGSTHSFSQLVDKIPHDSKTIIIDMHKMHYLDLSGVFVLEEFLESLFDKRKEIVFTRVQQQPRYLMRKLQIIPKHIKSNRIFCKIENCVAYLKSKDCQ